MPLRYYKLFDLLNRRGLKKSNLREVVSGATVAKLAKHEIVTTDSITKICEFLHCQPGDIMEMVNDEFIDSHGMVEYTTKETEHHSTENPVDVTAVNLRDAESGELFHKSYTLDEETE